MTKVFTYPHPIILESGAVLPGYHLTYSTHGRLNYEGDNVVWIFHALTANSDPAEWWPGLVGEDKLFDPSEYFIVCVNMPGSCYGSIGPLDIDPYTGKPYYHDFPFFTTRDMIHAYRPLKEYLGINRIHIGIGGSMGGQQLLEWAVEEPGLFNYIFPISTNAQHSPWGIAFNTAQRMAIEADGTWKEKNEKAGMEGMRAARATALLSYRHYDTYLKMQPRSAGFLAETDPPATPLTTTAASPDPAQAQAPAPPVTGSTPAPPSSTPGSPQASGSTQPPSATGSAPTPSGSAPTPTPPAPAPTPPPTGAASYQRYQGEKLVRRFCAFSYYKLSQSMDSHDLSRGRGSLEKALKKIQARTMVIGIDSDILFPLREQQQLATLIPRAYFQAISSLYGHDGFLLEFEQIERLVRDFLAHAEVEDFD